MSQTQYITPTLTALTYDQKIPADFGKDYGQAIGAAGQSLAGAITAVGGQYLQNKDVDDTLAAMNKNKILTDDEYQSVAGKSLGAKQQMLGLYAGQWLANQAQNRAVALQKGQYAGQIDVEHEKLLDTIKAIQGKYGAGGPMAAGVQPDKVQIQPKTTQPAAPVTQSTPAVATPAVGSQAPGNMILRPGVVFGQMKDPKTGNLVKGWTMPDGTFRPM